MKKDYYSSSKYRNLVKKTQNMKSYKERNRIVKRYSFGEILEIGCGEFPLFKNSIRIDIANINIKNLIVVDCNKSFAHKIKRKFDTIIALELIEHLYNVDNFLNECKKLLKPNGRLILSTPNVKYWKNRLWLLFGSDRWFDTNGLHLWFFSPESLKKKIESHGFEIIKMIPVGKTKILSFCGDFICIAKKVD